MSAIALFAQADLDAVDAAAGLFGGVMALMVVFWIIGIVATIFWLWMLVDALANEPTIEQKFLWFVVIFFLHFIGAFIYLFLRKSGRAPSSAAG